MTVSETSRIRGRQFWIGAILSPLPMVICLVLADALISGISAVTLVFAVIACLVVWVPLSVSCALLHLASWSRLKAHLGLMFVATFVPMLGVYKFYEFGPDASLSYQINNSGTQYIEFAVAGVVIALIAGFINTICMWIFWVIAIRPSEGLSSSN